MQASSGRNSRESRDDRDPPPRRSRIRQNWVFTRLHRPRIKIARSRDELVIDEAGRHLTLPPTFGRAETLVVPFDKLLGVKIEWIPAKKSDGGYFAPTLVFWRAMI
jgi:hypothetical protein